MSILLPWFWSRMQFGAWCRQCLIHIRKRNLTILPHLVTVGKHGWVPIINSISRRIFGDQMHKAHDWRPGPKFNISCLWSEKFSLSSNHSGGSKSLEPDDCFTQRLVMSCLQFHQL